MYTVDLRKVGGSVMLTIPPTLLDILRLGAEGKVGLAADNGRLVFEPSACPRYTLDELLVNCDSSADLTEQEREWLDAPTVGNEVI